MSQLGTRPPTDLFVDELHDLVEHRAACDLFVAIWGRAGGDAPLVPELLRAISHAGGYVAGARVGGELVGASVGFVGLDNGTFTLHSHITGIHPSAQGRGVGAALKRHQRAWAAARGIAAITWTFDPLVRRNGRFNLQSLGARAVSYLPDFYGVMDDAQNGLDPTDRCLVRWDAGDDYGAAEPDRPALLAAGAVDVLRADDEGMPQPVHSGAAVRLCWVPEDIVALRTSNPRAATAWRMALREAMVPAMAAGLMATGMTSDGWYVLTADASAP